MPAHQHVWRNFQIQQVIFEAAVTLADLEHVPQATPGPEHGVDVGAFDGAAEAIPELLHVGPFAAGRLLELHLLRTLLCERLELHILVAADAQRLCHFL